MPHGGALEGVMDVLRTFESITLYDVGSVPYRFISGTHELETAPNKINRFSNKCVA